MALQIWFPLFNHCHNHNHNLCKHDRYGPTLMSSPRTLFSVSLPKASLSSTQQHSSDGTHYLNLNINNNNTHKATQLGFLSKRRNLNLVILALFSNGFLPNMTTKPILAEELQLQRYIDPKEGFTLLRPSSWIKVDKAGATVLFEVANKGSNNVGVVVNPVRLTSLGVFGTPQFVAEKLVQAERRKFSCCIRKFKANSHESFSHIRKYK